MIKISEERIWCFTCENYPYNIDACNGCQEVFLSKYPPSKYVSALVTRYCENDVISTYNLYKKYEKEKKKMIITIIGSCGDKKRMNECKEYWERFGHKVNCPCDSDRDTLPLTKKQRDWIDKIEESDLVVAISKNTQLEGNGGNKFVMEFGESTSYEIAIAFRFNKLVIFW